MRGNVENGDDPITSLEKVIDKRRCSTANVDDRIVAIKTSAFNKGE